MQESSELLNGYWALENRLFLSVQDTKQESSLTLIRVCCRKPLLYSSQQCGKPGSLHVIGQQNKSSHETNFHNSFSCTLQRDSFFPQQIYNAVFTNSYLSLLHPNKEALAEVWFAIAKAGYLDSCRISQPSLFPSFLSKNQRMRSWEPMHKSLENTYNEIFSQILKK